MGRAAVHTMGKKLLTRKKVRVNRERESGFSINSAGADIPEYNSLYDQNLRHYYDNRRTQQFLYKCGMIDREGRVIDQVKNKSKLFIIEQEFKHAEKDEFWRLKEEAEFRRRIQIKRHEALEQARRTQRINDLKGERKVRRERIEEAKFGANGSPTYGNSSSPTINAASAEEMEDYLRSVFEQADLNEDGFLDHTEFKSLLRNADLGLSNEDVKRVMSEADEDDDGFINYGEFVPVAVQVLQGYHARRSAMEHHQKDEATARELAMEYLLHGMSREELEATMFRLFQKADLDQDGFLDRNEFRASINDASLNLSRREVNLLMAEADGDDKGKISYEEFVPLCFDLLLKNLQDDIFLLQRNRGELENYLLEIFQYADAEGCGFLAHSDIINLLELANLGLSQLQIATIVSAASRDSKGMIQYHKFISVAAEMISEMFHANMLSDRRKGQLAPQDVNDLSSPELHSFLTKLFTCALPDGSETVSMLAPVDFKRVLLSTDVGFTPEQMRRMLVQAEESDQGLIDCNQFVEEAVRVVERMSAQPDFQDQAALREREASELSRDLSVHGHTRGQLEAELTRMFVARDADGAGVVSRAGLYAAVHELKDLMSLERREVNALMISADEDSQGMLKYNDFVPLAYDVLRQSILDILIDSTPHAEQLQEYLIKLCEVEDPNQTDRLLASELRLVLAGCDLQLSESQIDHLLRQYDSPEVTVPWRVFCVSAGKELKSLLSVPGGADVAGFDWKQIPLEELVTFLNQLLSDAEEASPTETAGQMRFGVVKCQLASIDMGGGQTLTKVEVREVLQHMSGDDYGMVEWRSRVEAVAEALRGLRESLMVQVQQNGFSSHDLVIGRTVEQACSELMASLKCNDTNKDNKVSYRQFYDALEALGVPPEWLAYLLTISEEDDQGLTEISSQLVDECIQSMAALQQVDRLQRARSQPPPLSKQLLEAMAAADTEGSQCLESNTVKQVLRDLELGLKERHIITIISAAEKDAQGLIRYASFSKYAAGVIAEIAAKERDVLVQPPVLAQVNQYREASREVAALERSALYHLRAIKQGAVPEGITKLFTFLGKLTGHDVKSWFKIREMIAHAGFLGEVAGLDPRSLSDETKTELEALVKDPDCTPDQVSRPSTAQYQAAITLAKWVGELHAETSKQ